MTPKPPRQVTLHLLTAFKVSPTGAVGCFATGNYFVTMDVDTTVADPTLTARIRDEGGATLLTWTLLRSELQD